MSEDAIPDATQASPLGRYGVAADDAQPLFEVTLRGVPVSLFLATRQQHDELVREFTMMGLAHRDEEPGQPAEFRQLIHEFGVHYAIAAARTDEEVEKAARDGISFVDLHYQVPASVVGAANSFESLITRTDVLCEEGHMLTMPRTSQMKALAHWWLEELRRQVAGEPPTRWSG